MSRKKSQNSFISASTDRSKSWVSTIQRAEKNVMVFGFYGVGKSSIISRYILDYFPSDEDQNNLIDQKLRKFITYNKNRVELEVRDSDSFDQYFLLVSQKHAYNIDGYILVYSIDNRSSFEILEQLREKLFALNGRHLPQILIGNKHDNQEKRKVKTSEGKALADFWGIPFMEISAKQDESSQIDQIFEMLMEEVLEAEFPIKRNRFQLRKMSFQTREYFLKGYMLLNSIILLIGFALFLFALYLVIEIPQYYHGESELANIFLIMVAILQVASSVLGIIGCKYLKKNFLLYDTFLQIASVVLACVSMSLLQLKVESDKKDGLQPLYQIQILTSLSVCLLFETPALILLPYMFRIIKLQTQFKTLTLKLKSENNQR